MSRRTLQFSLFGLLFAISVVCVACVFAPPVARQIGRAGVGSVLLAAIITGPLYFIAFWWFKDVFKDFCLGLRRPDARLSRHLPDEIHVPESPTAVKRCPGRRRRQIRSATWWHPLGGYSKL